MSHTSAEWKGLLEELKAASVTDPLPTATSPQGSAHPGGDQPRPIVGRSPGPVGSSGMPPAPFQPPPPPAEDDALVTNADKSYINKLLNSNLIETKDEDIEMLRQDPSHPLHSVKHFRDLDL